MGRTMLMWALKGENLFWDLNDPFGVLAHPDTFLTSLEPQAIVGPCTHRYNVELHVIFQGYYVCTDGASWP
jgi:hypothetical protein